MKRTLLIIAAIITVSGFATAGDFMVELKAHYFSPSEEAFRDIYGGGITYGAEASIGIWKELEVWFGGSYFSRKGELTFTKEETKLELLPIGGGVKYRITSGSFSFYIGLGLNYYQYKEKNPIGDVSEGGLGFVGKIGSYVTIAGGLVVDFYVDYTYCKIKPADFELNIGGVAAGIGVGYRF